MENEKKPFILRNYKYVWSLLPPTGLIVGNGAGGQWVWGGLIFTFGIMALVEALMPENKNNAIDESDVIPNFVLGLHVPLQLCAILSLFYLVKINHATGWTLVGGVLSTGINTGTSGIAIAHELLHRKERAWRWCAKFLLGTASNPYFYAEHIAVHHRFVGTEDDHATARYGETLYGFFIRTVPQQFMSALKAEVLRLRKKNLTPYSLRNYPIGASVVYLLIAVGLSIGLGETAALAYIAQGFFASFLLEYANYIEHYGLTRDKMERVNETHSWQTDKGVSRYFLLELARHADHHMYGSRPYHKLRSFENAPVLPTGYAGMIYLALIPPLFFAVMHKRIAEFSGAKPLASTPVLNA